MTSRSVKMFLVLGVAAMIATPVVAQEKAKDPYLVVKSDGKVLGRDPDANIRFQLMRDYYMSDE